MTDAYIIIGHVGIVCVCNLVMLHVKFQAFRDLFKFEIGNADSIQRNSSPDRILQDFRTEKEPFIETDSDLEITLIFICFSQVKSSMSLLLHVTLRQASLSSYHYILDCTLI